MSHAPAAGRAVEAQRRSSSGASASSVGAPTTGQGAAPSAAKEAQDAPQPTPLAQPQGDLKAHSSNSESALLAGGTASDALTATSRATTLVTAQSRRGRGHVSSAEATNTCSETARKGTRISQSEAVATTGGQDQQQPRRQLPSHLPSSSSANNSRQLLSTPTATATRRQSPCRWMQVGSCLRPQVEANLRQQPWY